MDALEWLRKHLDADGSDLLREMIRTFAERLMAAEVEVLSYAGRPRTKHSATTATNARSGLDQPARVVARSRAPSRWPSALTPTAMMTATLTIRPPSRTFCVSGSSDP
jgi:hypothetical protein